MRFWNYGFLLASLISRDLKIRYRNMSLGFLWSVLNPLVMLSILVVVFTWIYPPPEGPPYFPVFVLLGLVGYNFLMLSIPPATSCVMENAPLVKKVNFPRHILPLSVVL